MMSGVRYGRIQAKWIHKDERGEIFCFYVDGEEHTVLTTKKGYARGGCIHNTIERAIILKGEVEYHVGTTESKGYISILKRGDGITIQPEQPHYFIALEDSIVLEWGAPPEQKKRKDPEWRKIVDEINSRRRKEDLLSLGLENAHLMKVKIEADNYIKQRLIAGERKLWLLTSLITEISTGQRRIGLGMEELFDHENNSP